MCEYVVCVLVSNLLSEIKGMVHGDVATAWGQGRVDGRETRGKGPGEVLSRGIYLGLHVTSGLQMHLCILHNLMYMQGKLEFRMSDVLA